MALVSPPLPVGLLRSQWPGLRPVAARPYDMMHWTPRWEWSGGAPSVSCGHEHARVAVLRTVPTVVRTVGARRLPDGVGRLDDGASESSERAWACSLILGEARALATAARHGPGGVIGAEVLSLKGSVRMIVGDEIRMVVGGTITQGACSHSGARVFGPLSRHVEVSRLRDVGEYAPCAGVGHPALSHGVLKESRGVPGCVLVTEAQLIERADAVLGGSRLRGVVLRGRASHRPSPVLRGRPERRVRWCLTPPLDAGFSMQQWSAWRQADGVALRCYSMAARRSA